jgi:two-component system, cell cycle sensor histidine kinase and response regulator CckA
LETFKKSPDDISLLITDIVMPRMNGRELAARIKEINPNVRVLFSSGYSDDRNMMRGTNEEFVDFINKPFAPEELARKVRCLLDRKI